MRGFGALQAPRAFGCATVPAGRSIEREPRKIRRAPAPAVRFTMQEHRLEAERSSPAQYDAIDSKQFAQLKKILGIFAEDQSTVFSRHLRNINQNARRSIEAATAPPTRGNDVSMSTLFTMRVREGRDAGDVIRE